MASNLVKELGVPIPERSEQREGETKSVKDIEEEKGEINRRKTDRKMDFLWGNVLL